MNAPVRRNGRRAGERRRRYCFCATPVALILWSALPGGLGAQAVPIQSESPPPVEMVCAPVFGRSEPGPVDAAAQAEVERLTGAATQAMILGDLEGALGFLDRALQRNQYAEEALYLRGRVLADRGDLERAADSFCRYLQLEPDGAAAEEARQRLDEAVAAGAAAELYDAFARGVERTSARRFAEAEAAFREVADARPNAAAALYNRAVVLGALGRRAEARVVLAQYMRLRPGEGGTEDVERLGNALRSGTGSRSPGTALALGMVLPGGGQYYTGRPLFGTAMLGLAGASVAVGYLHEETTLLCRQPDPDGGCPPEEVVGRETDRPWLVPAIGVAAAVTLFSAIEAVLHARGERRVTEIGRSGSAPADPRFELVMGSDGVGSLAMKVHLLRIPLGGKATTPD